MAPLGEMVQKWNRLPADEQKRISILLMGHENATAIDLFDYTVGDPDADAKLCARI